MPEPSRRKLAEMGRLVRFRKGEQIFLAGDPCPGILLVGSGAVRVYRTALGGKEHLLHLIEEGQTFAEVATIGRFPCPASAEAAEESLCLLLPRGPFLELIEGDHQLCLQLLASLTRWVHHLVGLTEDLVLRDAAGRVARHLLDHDSRSRARAFELPMLKRDLASHLNLTSETLSRTLRRLATRGLVRTLAGQRLQVVDHEGLRRVADGEQVEI